MCGIVAYAGSRPCAPILMEGLRKLEYRGYDSAGLAVMDAFSTIGIARAAGKLDKLDDVLREHPLLGSIGVGHTRWATHGHATVTNAHPHVAGRVAVVHNGIIENYAELRIALEAQGRRFTSETDTEVISHLIDIELSLGASTLLEATRRALGRVHGSYAIAVVSGSQPDTIVVAKQFSPLVLGTADGEAFAASDVPALLTHTRDVIYLEDGDIAELHPGSVHVERVDQVISSSSVTRSSTRVDWSPTEAERHGYEHFMLKEIFEQPTAVEATLRGRLQLGGVSLDPAETGLTDAVIRSLTRVVFVACGTSNHAALLGRHWIESIARMPAVVELASEFRDRDPVIGPTDLVVAVSQSGETADTLAAVHTATRHAARVLAVANVVGSAIPRGSSGSLYTRAGPEIGVASTKCFTAQLAALLLLAMRLGSARGTMTPERGARLARGLAALPGAMREALTTHGACLAIAREELVDTGATDCLFLGRGASYPVALEGALKLKEISYIHAEGYAAGEMKHGPIALVDEHMPIVVVVPDDGQREKVVSNVQEVLARDGRVIAIATAGDATVRGLTRRLIEVPHTEPELTPFLTVVPLQLLAYHTAVLKGRDVDQPRNLAKTVTVE